MKEHVIPLVGVLYFSDATPEGEIQQLVGYAQACFDYGIWKDGGQTIGCLPTPVQEAIMRKWDEIRKQYPLQQ